MIKNFIKQIKSSHKSSIAFKLTLIIVFNIIFFIALSLSSLFSIRRIYRNGLMLESYNTQIQANILIISKFNLLKNYLMELIYFNKDQKLSEILIENEDIFSYFESYKHIAEKYNLVEDLSFAKESENLILNLRSYIVESINLYRKKEIDKAMEYYNEKVIFTINTLNKYLNTSTENKKRDIAKIKKFNKKDASRVFLLNIIFIISIVIVDVVTCIIISFSIIKPINKINKSVKTLSEGKGDLTRVLEIKSNDELEILSSNFNMFINTLKRMVSSIKASTGRTQSISLNLSEISIKSSFSVEQIKKDIEVIKNKTYFLDNEVQESNLLAEDVKKFVTKVSEQMEAQTASIDESSASIEEMTFSIKNVAKSTEVKMQIIKELEKIAELGEQELDETIKTIKKVTDSTTIISEMVKVIKSISERTNVLAMNAAIEAAHAGKSGKGFTIVSEEIKKLADNTAVNSKEISRSLKEIIQNIQISEQSSSKAGNYFKSIKDYIGQVSSGIFEIKNTMHEMSLSANEITVALADLIKSGEVVKSSSKKMNERVNSITESLHHLVDISGDAKAGILGITTGVDEIYNTIQLVSKTVVENQGNVNTITDLVNKFKTE